MSSSSPIEWTDATWPIVAGCEFVSPECTNCYAINDSWRMAHNPNRKIHEPFFGTVDKTDKGHLVWSGIVRPLWQRLEWPLHWRRPRRIFVCNLADLFHPKIPFEFIAKAWEVMARCQQHTFQVLTKHPARMLEYFESCLPGTLPNVHLGTTAGDQKRADDRLPYLMRMPAAKRFLSYEPAIGPLELKRLRDGEIDALTGSRMTPSGEIFAGAHSLDWVIAGGESGSRARAPDPDWFRKVRDDCAAAGVAFHFKQWGAWYPCETDVIPERPGKVIYVDDDAIAARMGERSYKVIELHGKEFFRAGKKLAGRRLDERTHDERPA